MRTARGTMVSTMRALILVIALGSAAVAAEVRLGKPLTLKEPVTVAAVTAAPAKYVGKTVQVKGRVTEVCQMAGCWMALVEPNGTAVVRVKVNDGDIVFPKESVGRMAVAEGTLQKLELTREQAVARAKHEAEEQGRTFDPDAVKSGKTVYQVRGTGALLLD